ncbi:hypothetical protein NMY22_g6423 [Coprinellus aureogranulatus]|nr:hypothetical protein NMY22_g6423 [Coprinellus aureogranulatus]
MSDASGHRLSSLSPRSFGLIHDAYNTSTFERILISIPDAIFKTLGPLKPNEIQRLARCSSILFHIVAFYTDSAWNLPQFLKTWVENPIKFLAVLESCNAVISGSQALRFMDRLPPVLHNDLDIYTRIGGLPTIHRSLTRDGYVAYTRGGNQISSIAQHLSYLVSSKRFRRSLCYPGILGVYDYFKILPDNTHTGPDPALKVQIIVVNITPMRFIVQRFHSTAVMNLITSRQAISLFPKSTFLSRRSYATQALDNPKACDWAQKYRERGFDVVSSLKQPFPSDAVEGARYVGDQHSWVITFDEPLYQDIGSELERIYGEDHPSMVRFRVQFLRCGDVPDAWRISLKDASHAGISDLGAMGAVSGLFRYTR